MATLGSLQGQLEALITHEVEEVDVPNIEEVDNLRKVMQEILDKAASDTEASERAKQDVLEQQIKEMAERHDTDGAKRDTQHVDQVSKIATLELQLRELGDVKGKGKADADGGDLPDPGASGAGVAGGSRDTVDESGGGDVTSKRDAGKDVSGAGNDCGLAKGSVWKSVKLELPKLSLDGSNWPTWKNSLAREIVSLTGYLTTRTWSRWIPWDGG